MSSPASRPLATAHTTSGLRRLWLVGLLLLGLAPGTAEAQTTYRLHNESAGVTGLRLLSPAAADREDAKRQSGDLSTIVTGVVVELKSIAPR